MPGGTRKTFKGKEKGMTIPQLRRAFEHMQQFVKTSDYSVPAFRKEWEKTFGKAVSVKAAEDYLQFMKEHQPVQHGGMAPLEYQLRPGVDGPYGNFPPYVSSGFGHFNHDSFRMGCGIEDISPRVPASMGSNLVKAGGGMKRTKKHQTRRKQRGGALLSTPSLAEALNRPVLSSIPPGMLQSLQMDAKGMASLPSGDPVQNPLTHVKAPEGNIYTASTSPLSRIY